MAVRNKNVSRDATIARRVLPVAIPTATSLTDAVVFSFLPGESYRLVRARSFCRTKAGTVTFKVKVGTREAVASGTFTAATEDAQTLSTTLANVKGSASEAITIELTTDGSGALTNGVVVLEYRPSPLANEVH